MKYFPSKTNHTHTSLVKPKHPSFFALQTLQYLIIRLIIIDIYPNNMLIKLDDVENDGKNHFFVLPLDERPLFLLSIVQL